MSAEQTETANDSVLQKLCISSVTSSFLCLSLTVTKVTLLTSTVATFAGLFAAAFADASSGDAPAAATCGGAMCSP